MTDDLLDAVRARAARNLLRWETCLARYRVAIEALREARVMLARSDDYQRTLARIVSGQRREITTLHVRASEARDDNAELAMLLDDTRARLTASGPAECDPLRSELAATRRLLSAEQADTCELRELMLAAAPCQDGTRDEWCHGCRWSDGERCVIDGESVPEVVS